MDKFINHITLNTGHTRSSPRDEVSNEIIKTLAPWLLSAIKSGEKEPLPVPDLAHYSARAIKDVGLVVSVFGNLLKEPTVPIITFGIAARSREATDLWAYLNANFGVKEKIKIPSTPWCAVHLHHSAALFPDALAWLGDFERCVAWAWLSRYLNPTNKG